MSSDGALLEQVLGNLVSNAVRATPRGGVLVAVRRRAGLVRFEVWDTGVGIARADLARIFEEFVQIGNAQRDRRMGLGLGLSIARRSGALIDAAIDVASRPGRGSRFGFSQPVTTPGVAPSAPQPAPGLALAWDTALPVLVVDDDRDVRAALSDLLVRWGVPFDGAADGDEALRLVDGGARYGLVLADHRLAGRLNGLDLIAEIVARHPGRPPACALVTADADPALLGAARTLGVPLILKPLRPDRLRALLRRQMAGGGSALAPQRPVCFPPKLAGTSS